MQPSADFIKRTAGIIGVTAFLLFVALPGYGQIHRWVDKDGKVHYGDQPPDLNSAEQVRTNTNTLDMSGMRQQGEIVRERERQAAQEQKAHSEKQARARAHTRSAERAAAQMKQYKDCVNRVTSTIKRSPLAGPAIAGTCTPPMVAVPQQQEYLHGKPGTSYTNIGGTTVGSDGSQSTKIGNTRVDSDGSISTRIGNSNLNSNGTTSTQVGNTLINSDGTVVNRIGNTTFGSDGTMCIKSGNTTQCY